VLKNYEIIEHTADIGIRVKGKTQGDLFKNAALAMFDIISGKPTQKDLKQRKINIEEKAESLDELFINWLNELLSLSAAKGIIFTNFQFKEISERNIRAIAYAASIKYYRVNTEIKAATYHQLNIHQQNGNWKAEVIFDV
jgi:SHS2 domain-containing protein